MEDRLIQDYLRVTGGVMPEDYDNPEYQGQQFVKFSLLEATNFDYSNSTCLKADSDLEFL